MNARTSSWIPRSRIRFAVGITLALAVAGVIGSFWWRGTLLLLVPALAAGWAAFLMLQIRYQLSPGGGDWERRIHEFVASRLGLATSSRDSVLDIGCGDASLLVALLEGSPTISVTGVDLGERIGAMRKLPAKLVCRGSVSTRPFTEWTLRDSNSQAGASTSSFP